MKISHYSRVFTLLAVFGLLLFSCEEKPDPNPDFLDPAKAHTATNLAYGSDVRQVLDIYLPANRDRFRTRVFVWVHGGGWVDGDKSEFVGFKPWLEAVQDDYAYIAINYRLFNLIGTANRFPAQEEDLKNALAFIKSKLAEWDVSDQLVLAGGSAGGHLALLHSYKNNNDGLVKAAVAFFPPTELKSFHTFNLFSQLLLENLLGGSPQALPQKYSDSSPLAFLESTSVPTVFFHGDLDTVVPISQSELLEQKLKDKGVPHLREYIIGQGHGFSTATYQDLIGNTEAFLNTVLP